MRRRAMIVWVAVATALVACGTDEGQVELGEPPGPPEEAPEQPEDRERAEPRLEDDEEGAPASGQPSDDEADPSAPPEETIEGPLAGDAELEGGCAWLETDQGPHEIIWPEGYRLDTDPLRLVGPDGATVAEGGDRVRVTGRPSYEESSICMVGTIFTADDVAVP